MPVIKTKGAASSQGFGEFAKSAVVPNYIEDVFSTYIYGGTSAAQTINNNIDLSTKGGMVWLQSRGGVSGIVSHFLFDSVRGATNYLNLPGSDAQNSSGATTTAISSFNTTGFSLGNDSLLISVNTTGNNYVSWTFRKQPKFFDVVTYTGTGSLQNIAHNLGSTPGLIIIKKTTALGGWVAYHSSIGNTKYLSFNSNAASSTTATVWNNTSPTSAQFTVNTASFVNQSAQTYVAYLFASNDGGFGLTGTDNVITCGSYTGNGSATGPIVTLGFEPQWLIIKNSTALGSWQIVDNMRGMPVGTADATLQADLDNAESSVDYVSPTATGFQITSTSTEVNSNATTYVYIAIRRGPMKVPTTGTSVFGTNARTGTGANATVTGGQTDDAVLVKNRGSAVGDLFAARLTDTGYLETSSTAVEVAAGTTILQASPWDVMDGVKVGTTSTITNASGNTFVNYLFKRAPGFFDVVCYTGTGGATTKTHNLGVAPELIIVKDRTTINMWPVYASPIGITKYLTLNSDNNQANDGAGSSGFWNATAPTSSVFSLGANSVVNSASDNYVAYLFATCAGVSKVGSYTGTGATQTISCGFTGGARFVLVKRTDTTGDWYVWDTARGMVSGTDPSLLLNTTAAEVNANSIYTATGGFQIVSTAAGINASGGTYIFLAIA